MRWAGNVARMGRRWLVQGFGGETLGKITIWETRDRDRWRALVNTIMKLRVP
jgi:hypothetical protein